MFDRPSQLVSSVFYTPSFLAWLSTIHTEGDFSWLVKAGWQNMQYYHYLTREPQPGLPIRDHVCIMKTKTSSYSDSDIAK